MSSDLRRWVLTPGSGACLPSLRQTRSIRDNVVAVRTEPIERRPDIVGDTPKSLSKHERAALRVAVEEYERLTQDARVLTEGQVQRRDELLRTMRAITGYTGRKSGIKLARQLADGIDSSRSRSRKARNTPDPGSKRGQRTNWDFDATHVEAVVSTAVESSRRRH
jgi:hypothetical protein